MSVLPDYFDKIYVINLATRTDRKKEMDEQLARINRSFDYRKKRIKLFAAITKRSAAYMVKQVAGQFDTISSTRAYCVRLTAQKKEAG